MALDLEFAQRLVDQPTESLSVELKRWIFLDEKPGQAKIIKGVLALRNRNGGHLVIGIDDKTHAPDPWSRTDDVEDIFHIDRIQSLISTFASQSFEIAVRYPLRNGQKHVVIAVPPGIRVPVAAKKSLSSDTSKELIKEGDVYFRTLSANNIVSTSIIKYTDWPDLIDICLENREADIGRFMRRHLLGAIENPSQLSQIASAFNPPVPGPTLRDQALDYMDEGRRCLDQRIAEGLGAVGGRYALGGWEVSLLVDPKLDNYQANDAFFQKLMSLHPSIGAWPVWYDTRYFSNKSETPKVRDGAWETIITEKMLYEYNDFMRFEPSGRFYLWRAHDDDASSASRKVLPARHLDPGLVVRRVAEAMMVGLAFARGLECDMAHSQLGFAFRWSYLKNRRLSGWGSQISPYFSDRYEALDSEVTTFTSVPADTSPTALAPYINKATSPLFAAFGGYVMPAVEAENAVKYLLQS